MAPKVGNQYDVVTNGHLVLRGLEETAHPTSEHQKLDVFYCS